VLNDRPSIRLLDGVRHGLCSAAVDIWHGGIIMYVL